MSASLTATLTRTARATAATFAPSATASGVASAVATATATATAAPSAGGIPLPPRPPQDIPDHVVVPLVTFIYAFGLILATGNLIWASLLAMKTKSARRPWAFLAILASLTHMTYMILCLVYTSLLSRLAPGLTSSYVYARVFAKDPTVPPEAHLFVNIGLMLRPFVPLIGITLFFATLLRFKVIVIIKHWSMAWYKGMSITSMVFATAIMSYYIAWPVLDTVLVNKGLPPQTAKFHAQLGKMTFFIPFGLMMLMFYIADITLGVTVFLLIRKTCLGLARNMNSSMPVTGAVGNPSAGAGASTAVVSGTLSVLASTDGTAMSSADSKAVSHEAGVSSSGGSTLSWLKNRMAYFYGSSTSDGSTKTMGSAEKNLQHLQRNLRRMTIVLAFAILAPVLQAVLFTVGVTANYTGLTYIKAHTESTIVAIYAAFTVFMQIHFVMHYFVGIEALLNFKDHPVVTGRTTDQALKA
ncbi:hypothetical protein HK102_006362 [Quaeritorhiza haematococci]|nr:hypothetical protein HK102_006362 [Quaeritorhiza haematococci]